MIKGPNQHEKNINLLNALLIIPPVAYVGYPTLECATLSALFSKWGIQVKVIELNLELLEYFIEIKGDIVRAALKESYDSNCNFELIYLDKIAEIFDFENNFKYLDLLAISDEFKSKVIKKISASSAQLACVVLEHMRVSNQANQSLLWLCRILKKVMGGKGMVILTGSLINALPIIQRQMLERLKWIDAVIPIDSIMDWNRGTFSPNSKKRNTIESHLMVLPDFSKMKSEKYINFCAGTRIFPFKTSIGCKFKCTYCIDTQIWGRYKELPMELLTELFSNFIKNYQPDVVRFLDLLFNVNTNRIEALVRLINDLQKSCNRKKHFYWVGMATADIPISLKLANQLYESGCRNLWIGLESGSSRIRQLMNKVISPNFPKTLTNLKKAGISTLIYLIANYPGTCEEDIYETETFLEKNVENIDYILLSEFRLYKKSLMGGNPEKFEIIINNKPSFSKTHDGIGQSFSTVFNSYYSEGVHEYERLSNKWQELKKINNNAKRIFTIENFPILTEI